MARTLRVALSPLGPGETELDSGPRHYLLRVHRLGPGDRFVAFDPEQRTEAEAELLAVSSRGARCRIGELRAASLVSPLEVTLLQALGKGDKIDQVVRATTTLGVRRVVVVETERAIVRLGGRALARSARWRTIAVDAARQSGRGDAPDIEGPLALSRALTDVEARSHRRFCLDAGAHRPLAEALRGWRLVEPVAFLVGPEGGLSTEELAEARDHDFEPVVLGPLTLRTETAAIALMGAVLALSGWGDPPSASMG